mgnify:CR=1 FL=1
MAVGQLGQQLGRVAVVVLGLLGGAVRPEMVVALDRVIGAGYLTACLTNNTAGEPRPDVAERIGMPDACISCHEAPDAEAATDDGRATAPAATAEQPDDLRRVRGIGPAMKRELAAWGVRTLAELAALDGPGQLRFDRLRVTVRLYDNLNTRPTFLEIDALSLAPLFDQEERPAEARKNNKS